MDHIVYLDHKAKELENLLEGSKTMIIRGAMGRKLPYGRVQEGDRLFFVENNGDGLIRAQGMVKEVHEAGPLTREESLAMIEEYQPLLFLDKGMMKRFGGKRYLVLITVSKVASLEPSRFDRSAYGNMDDWLPVEDINRVMQQALRQ